MTSPRPDRPSDSNPFMWIVILALSLSLALLAASCRPIVAQERTIPQSGLEHAAAKAAYSLAAYGFLRELNTPKPVATVLATAGVWGLGWVIQARKGHQITVVDKAHDFAAHTLITIPLSLRARPRLALGALLAAVATIAVTCPHANPRSC